MRSALAASFTHKTERKCLFVRPSSVRCRQFTCTRGSSIDAAIKQQPARTERHPRGIINITRMCFNRKRVTVRITPEACLYSDVIEDRNSAVPVVRLDNEFLSKHLPHDVVSRCSAMQADDTTVTKETPPDVLVLGNYNCIHQFISLRKNWSKNCR